MTPAAPPAPTHPRLTGWRLALAITGAVAIVLRALLALFASHAHPSGPPPMPTWPLKAGDTFTVKPGDPAIIHWATSPDNNGFIVQAIELNGKPVAGTRMCALEPDYMADPDQPGGTLTLISQDGTGDWRVRWLGGDTLPDAPLDPNQPASHAPDQDGDDNANCGHNALITMSQAQLHAWLNMQTGTP